MLVLTVKITHQQRARLDTLIRKGVLVSYASSFRQLICLMPIKDKEIERLKRENAVLRAKVRGDLDEYLKENKGVGLAQT